MCRPQYRKDYTEIGGRPPAPIRWLPWESILLVCSRIIFNCHKYCEYGAMFSAREKLTI